MRVDVPPRSKAEAEQVAKWHRDQALERKAQEIWKATVDAENKRWAEGKRRERADQMEAYFKRFGKPSWMDQ